MTRRDAFLKVLTEVAGGSELHARELFDALQKVRPDACKGSMHEELNDEQAEEFMNELRAEKEGIAHLLIQGALQMHQKISKRPQ